MIKVIIAATFMGFTMVWMAWNLACMFCRWVFPGEKGGVPKMVNPPKPPLSKQELFARDMETYKKLEYWNQLNDQ